MYVSYKESRGTDSNWVTGNIFSECQFLSENMPMFKIFRQRRISWQPYFQARYFDISSINVSFNFRWGNAKNISKALYLVDHMIECD